MSRSTLILVGLVVGWWLFAGDRRQRQPAPLANPCPEPGFAPYGLGGFCAPINCPPTYVRVPPRGDCVPNGTRIL